MSMKRTIWWMAVPLLAVSVWSCSLAATTLVIVSPDNDATVHDNRGRLTVAVRAWGIGILPPGANFQALVDGKPVGGVQHSTPFELQGIDRGTHSLQVRMLGRNGETL